MTLRVEHFIAFRNTYHSCRKCKHLESYDHSSRAKSALLTMLHELNDNPCCHVRHQKYPNQPAQGADSSIILEGDVAATCIRRAKKFLDVGGASADVVSHKLTSVFSYDHLTLFDHVCSTSTYPRSRSYITTQRRQSQTRSQGPAEPTCIFRSYVRHGVETAVDGTQMAALFTACRMGVEPIARTPDRSYQAGTSSPTRGIRDGRKQKICAKSQDRNGGRPQPGLRSPSKSAHIEPSPIQIFTDMPCRSSKSATNQVCRLSRFTLLA